jgi:putative transposase
VRDREAVHGRDFVPRARALGIETILTAIRAPRENAIAERLVGTLRRECLDRVIILNEAHPRTTLSEFVRYYSAERPHRALALATPTPAVRTTSGSITSCPVLAGLHHSYKRAA